MLIAEVGGCGEVGDGCLGAWAVDVPNSREYGRERDSRLCYLYPVFWQLRFHGQHLPGIDIWVVRLIECLLQLL